VDGVGVPEGHGGDGFEDAFVDDGGGCLGGAAAGVAMEAAQDAAVLGAGAFGIVAGLEPGGDELPEAGPVEGGKGKVESRKPAARRAAKKRGGNCSD
jgi:hypothetical protein